MGKHCMRVVVLGTLCLVLWGCPWVVDNSDLQRLDSEFPINDRTIRCNGLLVNPTGKFDEGVTDIPHVPISSNSEPFIFEDMFMSIDAGDACLGTIQGFDTVAEAEAYWRRYVTARLAQLSLDSNLVFNVDGGQWCENPDVPVVCEVFEQVRTRACEGINFPAGFDPPLLNDPLSVCPGLLPEPPRVVTCDDNDPCDRSALCNSHDFGNVSVGDSSTETVRVTNCSSVAVSTAMFDGFLNDPGPNEQYDFLLSYPDNPRPDAPRTCAPAAFEESITLEPGETCIANVTYQPTVRGSHNAEMTITGSQAHKIALHGNAPGGNLVAQVSEEICMDQLLADDCTELRFISLSNGAGGGLMTVNNVEFLSTTRFRLEPLNLPFDLIQGADPVAVSFKWCAQGEPNTPPDINASDDGFLSVEFNDPQDPPLTFAVRRDPAGCETATIDPRLLAAYSFDASQNAMVVVDVTGNNFDGNIALNAVRSTEGRIGTSIAFNGTGGHVQLDANDLGLEFTGQEMTIALWFRANNFGNEDTRFITRGYGYADDTHAWSIGIDLPEVNLRFRQRTNKFDAANNSAEPFTTVVVANLVMLGIPLVPGEWTHVAATYDGTNMILYKDGSEVAREENNGDIENIAGVQVWLGDNPTDGQRSFDGLIDEVRIYDSALTELEINQVMVLPLSP